VQQQVPTALPLKKLAAGPLHAAAPGGAAAAAIPAAAAAAAGLGGPQPSVAAPKAHELPQPPRRSRGRLLPDLEVRPRRRGRACKVTASSAWPSCSAEVLCLDETCKQERDEGWRSCTSIDAAASEVLCSCMQDLHHFAVRSYKCPVHMPSCQATCV
jgi:hypothetical protein